MTLLDGLDFVTVSSAEHASCVIRAMRSKIRPTAGECTYRAAEHDDGHTRGDPGRELEPRQQGAADTANDDPIHDRFTLEQFNDMVRQELQAIQARREEEQVRKIGEELAAYDPDLPPKRRHHRKHPATCMVDDHGLQNDAASMPASHARSAGAASREMGKTHPSACPRSPPIALASRSALNEALVQKSPMGKGSSDFRDYGKVGLADQGMPDEQRQVDEYRGEGRGEKSRIAQQLYTLSVAVADEGNDAVPVRFSGPLGGEIPMSSAKPTSTIRQHESEQCHAVNSVAEQATSKDAGRSGGGMGGSDGLSCTSWSSLEEGGEDCAPSGGHSFGKVDDWEGTALYGSDDECCTPAHPVATSCPGRVQEKAKKSANSTDTNRRVLATVEGWVDAPQAREQGKTPHRRITRGSSANKIGGFGRGSCKGQFKFHTGGETGIGTNNLGRIRGARRRVSAYGDTEDSLPQPHNLSHIPSCGRPFPQASVEALQSNQHPYKKVDKSAGKRASGKVAPGSYCHPVGDGPLYGSDDCTGRQKGRLFPRGGKKWEETQHTRWGGSRSDHAVELDVVPGFGYQEEESWVVREFQARVDAARRQEAEEAKN